MLGRECEHPAHRLRAPDHAAGDTLLLVEQRIGRQRQRRAWYSDEAEGAFEIEGTPSTRSSRAWRG